MNLHFSKQWLIDTAERVAGTFVATFLGALVISTGHISLAALQLAAIAGVASCITVLKSIIGAQVGDPNSASVVPSVAGPKVLSPPAEIALGAAPPAPAVPGPVTEGAQ